MNEQKMPVKDLVVLVPCDDLKMTMQTFLTRRCESLRISPVDSEVRKLKFDSACFQEAEGLLRVYLSHARYALVLFDREGSGRDGRPPQEIEEEVERRLQINGWEDRARVVVVDPEVESWVWSDSPEVDRVCGWQGRIPSLRQWLVEQKFLDEGSIKPNRPKEALHKALRIANKKPSAALFGELAGRVGIERCTDRAFCKLKETLRTWFPAVPQAPLPPSE